MGTCVVRAEHRPCPWRMGPRFPASVYAGGSGSTHREHHAPGGGWRRVTATVPLIQGFSRGPPAFPGLPSPRTVPSRRLCRLSVVPWETDSTASCFTLPRNPPALLLVLSETYHSVALAALHRFWT